MLAHSCEIYREFWDLVIKSKTVVLTFHHEKSLDIQNKCKQPGDHNYMSNKTFNFHLILRRYSQVKFSAGIYQTHNLGLETNKHLVSKSDIKSIVELGAGRVLGAGIDVSNGLE